MIYEINAETYAILSKGDESSIIIENEKQIEISQKSLKIIDNNCKYYGSSYIGRYEGTKFLLGYEYKTPILISENKNVIFFPTSSPKTHNCHWISLSSIKNYQKFDNKSEIIFLNGTKLLLDISYNILENQIFRATRLESTMRKKRK